MTRLLPVLVLLAGCAANPAPPAVDFDADAWVNRAVVAAGGANAADPGREYGKQFSDELDAAVGWKEACDRWWNPDTDTFETDDASGGSARGTYSIEDLAGEPASVEDLSGDYIVPVTCSFAAYQGSYALVHIADGRAMLLAGQGVDQEGAPFGPPTATYATPEIRADGTFSTFAKARGLGDCGIYSTYEITAFGEATLTEARARECEGDPDAAGAPDTWPIVYPR